MPVPALFLDRDGVININHGYVHKREQFDFIDGIFDLVKEARQRRYKVVVITNQAGIGRGYFSESDFHVLTNWMLKEFSSSGAPIDRVYFSPFHPTAGVGDYLKDDFSRKPHPGMILQAQYDLGVDLLSSVLVGDKESDIQAGCAAGVGTNLLFSPRRPPSIDGLAYWNIATLQEAIGFLSERNERVGSP